MLLLDVVFSVRFSIVEYTLIEIKTRLMSPSGNKNELPGVRTIFAFPFLVFLSCCINVVFMFPSGGNLNYPGEINKALTPLILILNKKR